MRKFTQQLFALVMLVNIVTYTSCKKEDEDINKPGAPTIISVSPNEGTIGTELTIKGTNFQPNSSVLVGDQTSTLVEVSSESVIYAQVPAGIPANTLLSVTVRTDGGQAIYNSAFTAIAPVLSFVNSATKPSGNIGSTVILEGKAFGDVQGEGKILFSDGAGGTIAAVIANPEDWTNTFIITTVPQGAQDGPVVVQTATGTSNSLPFNITDAATFSPSAISWALTTALPTAVSGHKAMYVPIDDATNTTNQYVHVTGGRNSAGEALDQVLYGKINSDGTVSAWTATTALPAALSSHAVIAATPFNSKVQGSGYLYTLGGLNTTGEPISTVSVASLNNDGTVNSWSSTTELPQPLHSLGAVIFRSTIYIAGGATTGNAPVSKVYSAKIDSVGQLGAWEELVSLPSARAYHGFVTFGGVLYAVGGEKGTVTPDDGNFQTNDTKLSDVIYAKINIRTGALTDAGWVTNANSMSKARSKHTTLIAGGNIFVSSGLYSGAGNGSSENTYAQISSDGTVGSFNGATGSNTLSSTGGNHLFNQDGISYVDANGTARVMIIGGDDVKVPGTKQADVIYY